VKAIRGDGGAVSNAKPMSKDEAKAAKAKPKRRDTPVDDADLKLALLKGQAEGLGVGSPTPISLPPLVEVANRPGAVTGPPTNPEAAPKSNASMIAGALLVGLVMLGAALYKVAFSDGGITSQPEPVLYNPAVPIPHQDDPAETPPAPSPVAKKPPDPAAPPEPEKKPRPPPARMGQITLVTFPNAKVYRGKTELGMTPLFNTELPLGTHLLTLVAPDGTRRVLSVRIAEGKNTPMKVKLDELPTR
jgi:hypothetical protein